MLLALFACVYSVQSKLSPPIITAAKVWEAQPLAGAVSVGSVGHASSAGRTGSGSGGGGVQHPLPAPLAAPSRQIRHPNFNIVFFAIGFTLPACTAQLVCALFTRIFDVDYQNVTLFRVMFASYDQRESEYCPDHTADPATACAWCAFPVLSTLISGAFLLAFLLAFWVVTSRITTAAISKLLIKRIRLLQVLVTVSMVGSIGCRAATVLFTPFELGFELLRLAHVLFWAIALLCMSYLLVWRPVRDAKFADKQLEEFKQSGALLAPYGVVKVGWDSRDDEDAGSYANLASGLGRAGGVGFGALRGGSGSGAAAGNSGMYWQGSQTTPNGRAGALDIDGTAGAGAGGISGMTGDGVVVGSNPVLGVRTGVLASAGLESVSGSLRKGSTPGSLVGARGVGLARSSAALTVGSGFSGVSLAAGVGPTEFSAASTTTSTTTAMVRAAPTLQTGSAASYWTGGRAFNT